MIQYKSLMTDCEVFLRVNDKFLTTCFQYHGLYQWLFKWAVSFSWVWAGYGPRRTQGKRGVEGTWHQNQGALWLDCQRSLPRFYLPNRLIGRDQECHHHLSTGTLGWTTERHIEKKSWDHFRLRGQRMIIEKIINSKIYIKKSSGYLDIRAKTFLSASMCPLSS